MAFSDLIADLIKDQTDAAQAAYMAGYTEGYRLGYRDALAKAREIVTGTLTPKENSHAG
jgi:hypothetical protein